MLRSIKDIIGYPIDAVDGTIGKVKDCLFDDRHWRLRYLVADTGHWLSKRKALISPDHLKQPELGWIGQKFPVDLTKEQIEACPPLDSDAPVSRQYELEYARYYKHPLYWDRPMVGEGTVGPYYSNKQETAFEHSDQEIKEHEERLEDIAHCHLRSVHEVIGYHIKAVDGEIGHIADIIMEDTSWRFQYAVIDTRNWLPGKHVLIDIGWIEDLSWTDQLAKVNLNKEQIRIAPHFDPHKPINRDYEKSFYDYYGKPCYWEEPMSPTF